MLAHCVSGMKPMQRYSIKPLQIMLFKKQAENQVRA